MKRVVLVSLLAFFSLSLFAQEDSTKSSIKSGGDTIQIGSITIITKGPKNSTKAIIATPLENNNKKGEFGIKKKKVSTNWFVWDLGF